MYPPRSKETSRLVARPRPIYLDYQASAPVDPSVADVMCEWIRNRCGNPHSNEHAFGWAARDAVERARASVAAIIEADPEDIVFTSGATEANNLALFGAADRAAHGRDTILVSSIEHSSILAPARALATKGFQLIELPVDAEGFVVMSTFEQALSSRVLLVSIAAVNNEVGTLQDLQAIGARCRSVGALLHTDAAQALSARPLPLAEWPVDFASLSSHKSYGPVGIGALYVAPGRADHLAPQILGGTQQHGLRAGTLPAALCVGFGRACELLVRGGAAERQHVAGLRDRLWQLLKALIPEASLNGPADFAARHPGNLHVAFPHVDARELIQRLQPDLACSTGSACHSGSEEPSHVLLSIGFDEKRARSSLRLSLGRLTTFDEVQRAAHLIASALAEGSELVALSS